MKTGDYFSDICWLRTHCFPWARQRCGRQKWCSDSCLQGASGSAGAKGHVYILTSRTECSQVPLNPNLEVKDFREPWHVASGGGVGDVCDKSPNSLFNSVLFELFELGQLSWGSMTFMTLVFMPNWKHRVCSYCMCTIMQTSGRQGFSGLWFAD